MLMRVARLPHRIECVRIGGICIVRCLGDNPRCRAASQREAHLRTTYHVAAYHVATYPQRRATSGCTFDTLTAQRVCLHTPFAREVAIARRRRYLAAVGGRRFGVRDGTSCAGLFVARQPERSAALDAFARDGAQVAASNAAPTRPILAISHRRALRPREGPYRLRLNSGRSWRRVELQQRRVIHGALLVARGTQSGAILGQSRHTRSKCR